jgi:lipoprotein-releasing system ATP-binding protein
MSEESRTVTEDKMEQTSLISLKKVDKSFKDVGSRVEVLKGLDINVMQKEFIAIRGASGVGKSTLLHIMGLLDTATSGKVFFDNTEVTDFSDAKLSAVRNRDIGFVFQFHHLLPDFTAWENILMPRRIAGVVGEQDKAYARDLVRSIHIQHRLQHLPAELSGGERQRLALARALVHKPKILLADEPSGNLDEDNKKRLHHLLRDIHEQLGITIVVVTHDPALSSLAEKQYLLHDGKVSLEKCQK